MATVVAQEATGDLQQHRRGVDWLKVARLGEAKQGERRREREGKRERNDKKKIEGHNHVRSLYSGRWLLYMYL